MNTHLSALRPSVLRRARNERGAAVFVVVLVVSLLTGLGLYAMKTATLSNRASGYNRQLTQTHYVSDLGMMATAADLRVSLHDVYWLLRNRVPDPAASDAVCEAHYDQEHPLCVLKSYDELQSVATAPLIAQASTGMHGSLGFEPSEVDLRVEITDPYNMEPPAGYQIAGGSEDSQGQQFAMVTVTVTGLVMPPQLGGTATNRFDTASASAAGVERQRARIRMGPVLAQR